MTGWERKPFPTIAGDPFPASQPPGRQALWQGSIVPRGGLWWVMNFLWHFSLLPPTLVCETCCDPGVAQPSKSFLPADIDDIARLLTLCFSTQRRLTTVMVSGGVISWKRRFPAGAGKWAGAAARRRAQRPSSRHHNMPLSHAYLWRMAQRAISRRSHMPLPACHQTCMRHNIVETEHILIPYLWYSMNFDNSPLLL